MGNPVPVSGNELQLDPTGLTRAEFDQIRDLARRQFGLDLRDGKEQLVSARLGVKMRKLGMRSFEQYYHYVVADPTGQALVDLIDALTTNHTSFFREPAHFEFFKKKILGERRGREVIRVWSAACSSGEEPYTIAMIANECLGPERAKSLRVLATDISTRVLARARRGIYRADQFAQPLAPWLRKYLLRGDKRWQGYYRIKPDIVQQVEFRRLNLIEPFTDLPLFAAIFCRNVMIYFDSETQQDLVKRLSARLEPGGYLLIGTAESLSGVKHSLDYVAPAIFRKPGGWWSRGGG